MQKFCDRVTQTMCGNRHDPLGLQSPGNLAVFMMAWETELNNLELEFSQQWSSEEASISYFLAP
jgi:hypothetical protein